MTSQLGLNSGHSKRLKNVNFCQVWFVFYILILDNKNQWIVLFIFLLYCTYIFYLLFICFYFMSFVASNLYLTELMFGLERCLVIVYLKKNLIMF